MAGGNVYVFSVFSESIDPFGVNGLSAGSIPGWGPGYVPQNLRVGRVLNMSDSPGHFANGRNNVMFAYASGMFGFQVTIDGSQFPLNQDLILYVCQNRWTLYNPFGVLLAEGEVISQRILEGSFE